MRSHLITLLLVLFVAPAARAQLTPAQQAAIANQSVVSVVVRDGTWTGRLTELTADAVTIQPDGWPARTLPLATVLRIDTKKRDSLDNGALIGAAVGVLYCVVLCRNGAWMLMEGSVGMVIGSVIDAHHTAMTSIYRRPTVSAARKPGLFFTVRF